jgi:pre-mRNA-splicing factor CDC5/CEF1
MFQFGTSNWKLIEKLMIYRSARQCKERWTNYLSPLVKQSEWSIEEETQLIQLFEIYRSLWTKIPHHFNNRTPLQCKNYISILHNQIKEFELKKTN